jgi:arginyl-tRNA synthetase
MSIVTDLSMLFGDAFASLGLDRAFGDVVVSQRRELAQFQCNGALAAAKHAGKSPRDLATEIVRVVAGMNDLSAVAVSGPGFINITVTDELIGRCIAAVADDARLGVIAPPLRTIVVDYGGPNVAKELHVGHLRTALIGESFKRVLRFVGHEVVGDIHLGDWGLPMGQLIAVLADRRPDLAYFDPDHAGPYPEDSPVSVAELNELYPVASRRAKEDAAFAEAAARATVELQAGRPGYLALWRHFRAVSVAAMKSVYDELGVEFDLWHGESTVAGRLDALIDRLVATGTAIVSDGALVIEVGRPGDKAEIPPLMVRKSDGGTLYTTWDVATIAARIEELGATEMIYVVDNRQSLHFEQVFRAVRQAGIAPPEVVLEHAGNGTINGSDGKPLRTRDGGLPLLRDLISDSFDRALQRMDERDLAVELPDSERRQIARLVGLAALKYGDLQNHRASDYIFDLDRFTSFDGKTGPYLLYGAVRMQSIFREAEAAGLRGGEIVAPAVDAERALMLELLRLPEVLDRTVEHRAPNHIAEYAYELVAGFNRFYEACHILSEEDAERRASWLSLVALSRRQLGALLGMLGIEIPERM